MLLILLVFCVVFFCLEGEGGYLCCSSCKFSVLCFGDVYIAHLVSFLCYVFLGVMDVYFGGQSESVFRRRTDNTMAKRKSTKGQTTINKTYICF